ncbi:MAG: hypothetical protein JNM57_14945 [Cyclobacteriaceae bacterium]|nr:hypothetical protein [Cyclobacteriaceae bacterium]
MKLGQLVVRWMYLGTPYTATESEKRHVIFSNVIFLTLPVVYLVFVLLDLDSFLEPVAFWNFDLWVIPLMISLCFCFLVFNKVGFIYFSRILFLISWLLLLHILPIIIHQSPTDYYFAFPVGIIFHSLLIHVCFSPRNDAWRFWFFLAINFVLMLFSIEILVKHDVTSAAQNVLRTDPYYRLDIILYWLLFNLLTYYIFYVMEYYLDGLNEANILISRQQKELERKNEALQQANVSLQYSNQSVEDLNRSLEQKVTERTRELELKNEKLVEYAYLNAHLLRGPFCRVKGLVLLKNTVTAPSAAEEEINVLLLKSIDELDEVTTRIQRAVEDNELP